MNQLLNCTLGSNKNKTFIATKVATSNFDHLLKTLECKSLQNANRMTKKLDFCRFSEKMNVFSQLHAWFQKCSENISTKIPAVSDKTS